MPIAPLISLGGIGKSYPLISSGRHRWRTFWALLTRRADFPKHSVLEDISLSVYPGESLGLIGENGAGKSTLLKVIAGVVKPTHGTVNVGGQIGALLELGAGFHPEYSGRENIKLAAGLMGMQGAEMARKLAAIIDFADIGEYIDEPLKHYSSGMVVRLGFAVVTALRPDILITDEVLAVGDESFQRKCISWMESYLGSGGTLLLCSHSMFHIQKLCQKACWIHHGRLRRYGDAFGVTQEYLAYHEQKQAAREIIESTATAASDYHVMSLGTYDAQGQVRETFQMAEDVAAHGHLYSPDGRVPIVLVGLVRADGTPVYGVTCDIDGFRPNRLDDHRFGFSITFSRPTLLPGEYLVRAHAMDPEGLRLFDTLERPIRILGQTRELGFCRLSHRWEPASVAEPSGLPH